MYNFLKRYQFAGLLLLSLLLHFVFLLCTVRGGGWLSGTRHIQKETVSEQNIVFEIIETSEDSRIKEQTSRTNLVSDKQSEARDLQKNILREKTLPFSQGVTAMKNPFQPRPNTQSERADLRSMTRNRTIMPDNDQAAVKTASRSFSIDQLFNRMTAPDSRGQNTAAYEQKRSSADKYGGVSFNTYNWEFGPYLLELKSRIKKHIYPPPAFTHLGFGGKNILKFKIYPDGTLEGPVVLDYQGQRALTETSMNAVMLSAPFWPLPDDFPEAFLEVTANFDYIIHN